MGSSDIRNCKAIDASVGGLVWVRRRNGSWWPGRIMGHHEVPDCSSTSISPKSGTPIKLLGRDDASMDWYNLEKSKRVKAFRCGEYDACIETAKATTSTSSKKAVKYARREDAIAHALEIESAHLVKDNPECIEKVSTSGEVPRISHSIKGNEDLDDVTQTEVALRSSMSLNKTSYGTASKLHPLSEMRRRTPDELEDDVTDGNKRKIGLEDIGMGRGSKGIVQVGALLEDKQEHGFKNDININGSVINKSLSNGSSRDCSLENKRKRPPVVNGNEYSKRKKRRMPLEKVLESTDMASVPATRDELVDSVCLPSPVFSSISKSNGVLCENVFISINASESVVEAIHNKGKDREISNISVLAKDDSSNGLFDVALIGEGKFSAGISTAAFTSSSPRKTLISGPTRQFGKTCHDDVAKNKESNGSPCSNPAATLISRIEKSASKWQLKGKRNSRQMSKKQEERRNAYAKEANNDSGPHCSVFEQKLLGHFSGGTQAIRRNSELCDVTIETKAKYKPRNVPLISLGSKLNGEAVFGHPLTIEVLEDGSCDCIVSNHVNPLGVPKIDDVRQTKASSKKMKPHIPPYKSLKSKKASCISMKTRCLSSISGQTISSEKVMIEETKERIVVCIPLKVVFSRIKAVKGSTIQVLRS